jgi:hypothetical protein
LAIDPLYDPTSPLHVTIYHNLVQFIQDYQQSKYLPRDGWVCHMHTITVKKYVNDDECGFSLSIAVYCLIHGLDYCTTPPTKFNNQARLFMFYTVIGLQFNQDDSYDPHFNEVRGNMMLHLVLHTRMIVTGTIIALHIEYCYVN